MVPQIHYLYALLFPELDPRPFPPGVYALARLGLARAVPAVQLPWVDIRLLFPAASLQGRPLPGAFIDWDNGEFLPQGN